MSPRAKTLRTIADLVPNDRNANRGTERGLDVVDRSLEKHGAARSVVADCQGKLIAGNKVAMKAAAQGRKIVVVRTRGRELVVVQRTDLDMDRDPEAHELAVADNRSGELGLEWDSEILELLKQEGVELADYFTDDELNKIYLENATLTTPAEPDETVSIAEELRAKWKTRRGQLWEIPSAVSGDSHRLLIGSCTNAEHMARLMNGRRANVAVTSPPYGVGKSYEKKGVEPWFETVRPAINQVCQHAKIVAWNIGDLFGTGSQFIEPTFAHSIAMFAEQEFRPLWIRIWVKQGLNFAVAPYYFVTDKPVPQYEYIGAFVDSNGDAWEDGELPTSFDYVLAFAGPGNKFKRRLTAEERKSWGFHGVWHMTTVAANDDHPAKFPVELPWRIIKIHSDPRDLVLDIFGGSLTTMDAAEQLGRVCYAMEIDPAFAAVGLERMSKAGLQPRHITGRKGRQ